MHVAALARDPFGELVAATNGAGQTTSYGYDTEGNVTSVTYPLPASATSPRPPPRARPPTPTTHRAG